jgi:20S proteasome alpha/beta subunit
MTVVAAVVCADGVVIGADSQVTDPDRGLSYPGQKLHDMGTHAAWGGSGARSVLGDLEKLFRAEAEVICGADDVGRALQERTVPVLQHHYASFITDVPGQASQGTPAAYVLAAGWGEQGAWIVEVTPNGLTSRYEDIGFHAIGSGSAMAQQAGALLSHVDMVERSVKHGVVGMVRVLDGLRVTNPNVGLEIDVCAITADGAHHLSEAEVETARTHVARWRDGEAKVLDRLFRGR